jgi:hypothetical protein
MPNYTSYTIGNTCDYLTTTNLSYTQQSVISIDNEKLDIFMIFYINVDGMTKNKVDEYMSYIIKTYNKNNYNSFNVEKIFLPVKNQKTKVEIINPNLINEDIIKSFKNLVDTLDDDKYKELINKL